MICIYEKGNDNLLSAELTISSGDYVFRQELDPKMTNDVTIRDNLGIYTLTINKTGYKTYIKDFTSDELKNYTTEPLIIELELETNGGLVVYYSFNGNAHDNNNSGYNGIVNGASLCEDRNQNPNSAYKFDGVNDYIEVVNFGNIVPKEEITISLWAKSEVSKAQFALLLCPENSGLPQQNTLDVCINYYHDGGNWIFWDFGWRGEGGNAPGRLYKYNAPFDTYWHHYVFISSISQSVMKIYKDGELLNLENDPLDLCDAKDKYLRIGSGEDQRYFEGIIDEIYVYNRILSESEILALLIN